MTQVKDKKQKSPTPRKDTEMRVVGIKNWEPSHKKYYDHMSRWVMDYYEEINLGMFLPPGVSVNPDGNFFWKWKTPDEEELVDKNGYGISEDNDTVTKNLRYGDLLEIFENGVKYGIEKMKREFWEEEVDFVLGYSNYDEKKRIENTKYPVHPHHDWIRGQMEKLLDKKEKNVK
jgi:hypothetical protein